MHNSENIIQRLASSLGRRDEEPNISLANDLIKMTDKNGIKTLVENLQSKKAIQNDCIKVLYEIGAQKPRLIAPYLDDFLQALETKNNRLQWGLLTAINYMVSEKPEEIYKALPSIISTAEKGSVISKDNLIFILINFCKMPQCRSDAFALLVEQLMNSKTNQLPMYAERSLPIIDTSNKEKFVEVLSGRLADFEKESKRKRVEKVIKKVEKLD